MHYRRQFYDIAHYTGLRWGGAGIREAQWLASRQRWKEVGHVGCLKLKDSAICAPPQQGCSGYLQPTGSTVTGWNHIYHPEVLGGSVYKNVKNMMLSSWTNGL